MKKRVLALLLVFVLVAGMLPTGALAAETSPVSKATVSFTAQAADAFLCAPQLGVEVASDLAESYGYTDSVAGVSALDVLVKAHQAIFEDLFTPATAKDYLTVDGSMIKKIFGVETYNCFFTINGQQPHDNVLVDMTGVPGGKSYTGYTIDQAAVKTGDLVEFWIYQNSYGMDKYPLFQQGDDFVTALQGGPGEALALTLKWYWIGWYGCVPMETLKETPRQIQILEDAQLAWVNTANGTIQAIEGTTVPEDGAVTLTLPSTKGNYYLTVSNPEEETVMPLITVTVYPDAAITVPSDATLFVGSKTKHFVAFTGAEPAAVVDNGDGTSTYYYDLANGTYNYRVSGEEYITYAGKFSKSKTKYTLTVTAEQLKPEGKTKATVERDLTANSNYNVADIYLNINAQGYLKLGRGDTYQLVNLRNWEAVDTVVSNYFIEPDYHYTVLDEAGKVSDSVVSVSDSGLVTAVGEGSAIVLVTYDALQYAGAAGGPFFGAIWPENTGVFVASVGAGDSGIKTGMTINEGRNSTEAKLSGDALDAEHDVIYFTGERGSYTFTPGTAGCTVAVANPTVGTAMSFGGFTSVTKNSDGSFTVPLTQGRNIVKLSKAGKSEYQVITAKQVTVTAPEHVAPGDPVSVSFDTLYHPANKLAGVYNMNAAAVYTDVDGYAGQLVGGPTAQYNFASNEAAQTVSKKLERTVNNWGNVSYKAGDPITVPEDWAEETFTLSGGSLVALGFGDPYGNHRGITLEQGKAPNFNAATREAYLGRLPDLTIPVTLSKTVTGLTVSAQPTKTEYYVDDSFDPAGLVVHAVYSDGTERDVDSYTVSPEVLTANTTAVTVHYGGKQVEVPVTVTVPVVTGLAVTTPPARTAYTAGDVFDPTGMVVTATYANGKTAAVADYALEPKRALQEADTEITVKLGEFSATTPITVAAAPAPGPDAPAEITVQFTLLGDDHHNSDSDGNVHTLKANNLTTWIAQTGVTVSADAKVIDVIARALGLAGIPYENPDGNYITAIRGLEQFSNGDLSGWMYTLNGSHPNLGVAEQGVKNGDRIVFHYTDDYTRERGSENWGGGTATTTGGNSTQVKVTVEKAPDGKPVAKVELPKGATSAVASIPTAELGGGNVLVRVNADGSETVIKKSLVDGGTAYALLNGSCTVKVVDNSKTFDDTASHWGADAIAFASSHALFAGVSATSFAPDAPMSRAMLATVLYRLEDAVASGSNPFADVPAGTWYTDAVTWANGAGIVQGTGKGFAPDDNITREQLAAMLYRYAKTLGMDTAASGDLSKFTDGAKTSAWATDAMKWAIDSGLIFGKGNGVVDPTGNATRAEVAAILQRMVKLMVK